MHQLVQDSETSRVLAHFDQLKDTEAWGVTYVRAHWTAREVLRTIGAPLEGRRVAVLIEPGPQFVAAFFGILLAGGTVVVLSPLHPDTESAYFCQDSRVALILVSRTWKDRARSFAPECPYREIEEFYENAVENPPESTPLSPVPRPKNSDAALQLYTSGTTGKPKGAVLTHRNLGHQQFLLRQTWKLCSEDSLLHILPLHHMHGLCIALLSCLSAGARVDFMKEFRAPDVWERMKGATVFMAVPTIYAKLLQAYDQADHATQERWKSHAKNLRLATSGSAALPVSLAARWKELTGNIPLERFGMTEVGVAVSNPLDGTRVPGRVGLPLPTVQTRIVEGELWIAGPSVFSHYYERPDATQAAFVNVEGVRFFRTGDTVELSEDGSFRVLGRTSVDILKSGGYKLSALEIEEAFRAHSAVAEVAVIGLPDPVWGERVIACVVLRSPIEQPSAQALRSFAKESLAAYKVPKEIFFLQELPKNALGKVLKPQLKQVITIELNRRNT